MADLKTLPTAEEMVRRHRRGLCTKEEVVDAIRRELLSPSPGEGRPEPR